MNIDKRWIFLLAVSSSAAVGAVMASRTRRRHVRAAGEVQRRTDLKAWENEGGNLAPAPASAVQPIVES